MGSIRKILLINVFGLVIILLASTSYAGMGGGHHMPNYGGNGSNMPNRSFHENFNNNQQFNNKSDMHGESGRSNQSNHNNQDGMMDNNVKKRNSSIHNYETMPVSDMNHQPYHNGPGRN